MLCSYKELEYYIPSGIYSSSVSTRRLVVYTDSEREKGEEFVNIETPKRATCFRVKFIVHYKTQHATLELQGNVAKQTHCIIVYLGGLRVGAKSL